MTVDHAQPAGAGGAPVDVSQIPVVILCGGQGTRIREASEKLPKPMIEIGEKPIVWHIMKTYYEHGFRNFVLCLGYKSDVIKSYFLDRRRLSADVVLRPGAEPEFVGGEEIEEDWTITLVETGLDAGTGGRVKLVSKYLDAPWFMLTYGDGIGDIDISAEVQHAVRMDKMACVTGVHPASRYGEMHVDDKGEMVTEFNEKPTLATGWVSGGFFMMKREFVDRYLADIDEEDMLEKKPLQQVSRDGELAVYEHEGFWMGMDTFRDWKELNGLWDADKAPWKIWKG
ncbi:MULTISPECIES: sugar phosphate nucleotidyltransferase [Arsenicicoccus]|uniref:NTP transferase domain-containing protein n=1 Tax=Arsenicicoccus bolidensis TaxID=229480 RepID=A0ABS9PXK0_9MICO|nr:MULTISPECIES: sugar phosphate nucleotidyltransferase [Arsenicicoccus]MCG7320350.1 NTP transferase domain-containing protein [Arsenicicoccus bolidensis]